jgi:predicted dehydrogenase
LADGVIGQLLHFSGEAYGPVVIRTKGATWRSDKQEGGGCLYDYSSHVINLIQYLLGNPVEVRGTLMKKFFSRNVDDAVYSTLTLDTGLTGTLSVNWSDETYRKMSTSVTIWGSEGKISADSQELKIYLKRENEMYGLKKGWNIKYITDFKQQVWFYLRGEEYSTQIDYFVNHVCSHDLNNINSFASALSTDKVIRLLMNDAEAI